MKSGCPSAGFDASWAKLFVARGASNKIGIISPKHSDAMKDYFKNYLKNTWLPSIRDNGGFYADIDYVTKKIEVSTDLVSFVVEGGEVIPTNKDSPEGYWSGGQRFWPSGSPSVLKVVSALLMSGVPIEWVCANTSDKKPFGKPMALTPNSRAKCISTRELSMACTVCPCSICTRKHYTSVDTVRMRTTTTMS